MVMLLVLPFVTATSQTNDYRVIFGKDWEKALSFLRENNHWIDPVLGQNHVSYPVAVAVIFPELVRYSAIQDKIEITLYQPGRGLCKFLSRTVSDETDFRREDP
jgi:hypothetical protein